MKVEITIPDFMSVEQYQIINNIEHLTELNKTIRTISVLTGVDEAELKTWDVSTLSKVYRDLNSKIDYKESFHPIFSYEDTLYGFSNIDTMTLGEDTDLERLCKEPNKNLHEIMAILYRPIKKHNFKNIVWQKAQKILIKEGKSTNIWKQYKLKKYDVEDRYETAERFKQLPVNYALGAMSFFLATASGYLTITAPYSTEAEELMLNKLTEMNLNLLKNIGTGLRSFMHYPKQVYSLSQGTEVSLT